MHHQPYKQSSIKVVRKWENTSKMHDTHFPHTIRIISRQKHSPAIQMTSRTPLYKSRTTNRPVNIIFPNCYRNRNRSSDRESNFKLA